MAIDNDTRGWIMAGISGLACVVGASIICVDIIVRLFPKMHDFSIAESDAFLSASLSLSFGVMLYSALYSMLPQSQTYLQKGGYSPQAAAYLQIGLFLGGVIGIRILSQVIHHFIPSHIVDCDHTHDEESGKNDREEMAEQRQSEDANGSTIPKAATEAATESDSVPSEASPLLLKVPNAPPAMNRTTSAPGGPARRNTQNGSLTTTSNVRRPGLVARGLSRTISKYVSSKKDECDENGPCMGFTDPCGQDCFKVVQRRAIGSDGHSHSYHKSNIWPRASQDLQTVPVVPEDEILDESTPRDTRSHSPHDHSQSARNSDAHVPPPPARSRSITHYHRPEHEQDQSRTSRRPSHHSHQQSVEADHHHHVPTNAFMAIGLQTSLAIALHKAPEGFITYATNHANPTLGFAVFMALFIHNITEGFAMSLPLYLALGSRTKAIIWSSVLGGVSQPLGAGVAALWFKVANDSGHGAPDEGVYGGMFAVTSGVMASVALSLFSESLGLTHNKNTCIAFAFFGMAILGLSFALTAK